MANRPAPLPPPRLLCLHDALAAWLAGPRCGERPDRLDHFVLVLARKQTRDGGEELINLVWVLDGNLAVCDNKGDIDIALILERGNEAAQLAVDPADVEVGDDALEGKALDAGRVLDEAATPLL
ncbi:hypothetical protein NQ176_g10956 [Zarea fungicola]|uniref:Uncharacterized protein n=1 Tax=Zarea fungicola TaxID=93591 RepID=A0ACC1MEY1_9HYPO|nr:hypothetical protein NQ176_g10956 [Lecanicillium fungicola]